MTPCLQVLAPPPTAAAQTSRVPSLSARFGGASLASVLLYTASAMVAILGCLFHEHLAPLAPVGAALAVGAAVALNFPRKTKAAAADRGA